MCASFTNIDEETCVRLRISSFDKNSPFSRASSIDFATFIPNPSITVNGGMIVFGLSGETLNSTASDLYKSTLEILYPRAYSSSQTSSTSNNDFSLFETGYSGLRSAIRVLISFIRARMTSMPFAIVSIS